MPCESGYMEPSYGEIQSKKVCQHIVYLYEKLGLPTPKWVKEAAKDYYGNQHKLGGAETMLYKKIKNLSTKELDSLVYNARSKNARELATWFEDFEKEFKDEVDRTRREAKLEKTAKSLLSKMRADEVEILRNYLKDKRVDEVVILSNYLKDN